jgi:hypothetical protein
MLNDSQPPATLLTTTMSPFFSLPSELRKEIYFHYVYNSSGCHYDLATRKMRDAAGLPINLALIFTCKMIASEMSGLALQHFHDGGRQESRLLGSALGVAVREMRQGTESITWKNH